MTASGETRSGGVGFLGVLTILFIALKLTGVIGWSWWWVLAPLWLPWAVALSALAVIGLAVMFVKAADERKAAKRRAAIRERRYR